MCLLQVACPRLLAVCSLIGLASFTPGYHTEYREETVFDYYCSAALHNIKRSKVLTALMVATLALGIGSCMTTLTVLRVLSGDPVPQKSANLFYPQIDPRPIEGYNTLGQTRPLPLMTYVDAVNLLHAKRAKRQALVAMTSIKITPTKVGEHAFFNNGVMTTSDFFPMFDASFQYGGGWREQDDRDRSEVVVISDFLNNQLFGGVNSVGRAIRINGHYLRVVGVLKHWAPQPRFYALELSTRIYGDGDAAFLPLTTARTIGLVPDAEKVVCWGNYDFKRLESSPCAWVGFWVELNGPTEVAAYRAFLSDYVHDQIAAGQLERPEADLSGLLQWLRVEHAVPDDVRLQVWLAFGFLLVCIVNTVGLLLAKNLRRSREIGIRRALGATRRSIFMQFMIEAGVIGVVGGIVGLAIAELGLWVVRHQPSEYASLATLDTQMFLSTFAVALATSLIAGLLPAWRACSVTPAPQLRAA